MSSTNSKNSNDRLRSLEIAVGQIEKQHGSGTIMRLGDGPAEPIGNLNVEAGGLEDPVNEVFKAGAADVEQLVGGDNLDGRHQERSIVTGAVGKCLQDPA